MADTEPKKAATGAQEKPANPAVAKAAGGIFSKIKSKLPIDSKRVDEWQKNWLAMPEHRTKYEHLKDAPNVVGEELFAMTNDIIDFCQKQPGGQSHIFKSIKDNLSSFFKYPVEFLRKKAEESKKKAAGSKEADVKKSEEAKEKMSEAKGSAEKKVSEVKKASKKVKSVAEKTKKAKNDKGKK